MPGTRARSLWLGGDGRGGDGFVDDLGGLPANVTGWGGMAGDNGSGHSLKTDRHWRKY